MNGDDDVRGHGHGIRRCSSRHAHDDVHAPHGRDRDGVHAPRGHGHDGGDAHALRGRDRVHVLRGHGHDGVHVHAHVLPLLLYDVPLQEVSSQENPVLP